MLVLTRKVGERILIGDHIAVTIVKIGQGGVRLGIEAPPEYAIMREEIQKALEAIEFEQAPEEQPSEIAATKECMHDDSVENIPR